MDRDELIRFYAKAYNTIQEIVRTHENEQIDDGMEELLNKRLHRIDDYIETSDYYLTEQKDEFIELTDHISNRIYFNC